jgi:hypothetical protein
MDITTFGSYVALGLAGLKVLEFSRDRKPKIYVEKIFRGVADLGHDLILLNSSKVPSEMRLEFVWRILREHEGVVSGGKVNRLIDGLCGERLPTIHLAHVDLS